MSTVSKYAGKVNAPEFPSGLDWLNVESPLTMADPARQVGRPGLLDLLLN